MPQNTAITIKDGKATPKDHTFSPTKIDANNIASFQERVSGVPVGYPTITWSVRAPTNNSPAYKVSGKITQPKVIVTTDATGKTVSSVDYSNLGTVELIVSERSTKEERTDLRVLVSNLLQNAAIISSVDDLESFW